MHVPAIVVLNAFPLLAAAIVLAVPPGAVSRSVAFLASSFLATAGYILSVAALLRLAKTRPRKGLAGRQGR